MSSPPDKTYFLIAVLVYGISSLYTVFLWRRGFRKDNRVTYCLLLGAFVFHTTAMIKRGLSLNRCPIDNLYEATSFFMWALVGAYLVLGLMRNIRFLGAFASPLLFAAGIFALFPGLDVKGPEPRFVNGPVTLHAALILLGYGGFALASVAAVMYLTQEHDLKFNRMKAVQSLLPPVQRLEQVNSRMLVVALILLTVGLGMSPLLAEGRPPREIYLDAKFLWSAVVWVAYCVILILHLRGKLTGRRLAWSTVGSFAFILLTFWGTNLLSELH